MHQILKIALVLIFLMFSSASYSQNPNKLLHLVYAKINAVKDYAVDVNIKVDLPFIKMLPINAKIYYKQKDKFKVYSKSIAIVPRQGFVQLTKLINDTNAFTAMYQSTDVINNVKVTLINVIPLSDTGDVVLGKLWVDEKAHVIMKSQITSKQNGTILTNYEYDKQLAFGLPDRMVFEVDIKKFKIPKAVAADINTTKTTNKEGKKGKIAITLTNYLVNKGISDAVFKK
jgi:outer membrane lipoprotein-sorting protein